MKTCLIISGGPVDREFAAEFLKGRTYDCIIAVDAGLETEMCIRGRHIIHRDIKPQNMIISRDGKVKVADFGIARAVSSQTIGATAMGSVHYISPEQARGGYSDERSDIYSLGITIYEMVTGHVLSLIPI